MAEKLTDRDCVLLDGRCDCPRPVYDHCKYAGVHDERELEGKCHALWLLHGGETSEWNGTTCDCEWIQGNLNCKLNPF